MPSKFSELFVCSYNQLNDTRKLTIVIPYKNLTDVAKPYCSGYYLTPSDNGGAVLAISKSHIIDYGLFLNGYEVNDGKTHEIWYR